MKTDYPELEGKRVKYNNGGMVVDGIVVGCNYHIGITIKHFTDKNRYLVCLNGPNSPVKCKRSLASEYRRTFHAIVKHIKNGALNHMDIHAAVGRSYHGGNPSSSRCPYGQ